MGRPANLENCGARGKHAGVQEAMREAPTSLERGRGLEWIDVATTSFRPEWVKQRNAAQATIDDSADEAADSSAAGASAGAPKPDAVSVPHSPSRGHPRHAALRLPLPSPWSALRRTNATTTTTRWRSASTTNSTSLGWWRGCLGVSHYPFFIAG